MAGDEIRTTRPLPLWRPLGASFCAIVALLYVLIGRADVGGGVMFGCGIMVLLGSIEIER